MKIELEPTGIIESVNGTPCRQWKGTSDQGVPVVAFVALIRADAQHASLSQLSDFERELSEVKNDRQLVSFDNRMVV